MEWHKEVWFPGNIPKHAFILLSTKSRLANWGVMEDITCVLCEIFDETRDHLLLYFPYSQDAFKGSRLHSWGLQTGLLSRDGLHYTNKAENNLRLLMAQAIIYSLWKQRNERILLGTRLPAEVLFKKVDRGVRDTCIACKDKPGFANCLGMWFRGS